MKLAAFITTHMDEIVADSSSSPAPSNRLRWEIPLLS